LKRLHFFIIRSFIGPFVITFSIAMFFLVMQFLWKYIDDLMGKGIEIPVLMEMLFYVSAGLIPLALPLAVLFSSIMTYGNLAENNELTALKASGMSLFSVMKPIFIFVLFLSLSAFYFSNYVLPIANLKWKSIYYDILEKKPTFNLKEGVFFKEFDNYQIKVNKKNDNKGTLTGILIYDYSTYNQRRVIRAKSGQMFKSEKGDYLFLQMLSGVIYEKVPNKSFDKMKVDFQKSYFKEAVIRFNISGFDFKKSDEGLFKQEYEMMNFLQLSYAIDSLKNYYGNSYRNFNQLLAENFVIFNTKFIQNSPIDSGLQLLPEEPQLTKVDTLIYLDSLYVAQLAAANLDAQNELRNTKDMIYHQTLLRDQHSKTIELHLIAWHKKFTLSFSIIVLFFIGAPLGAIIRKGGLGTPLVFATLFFLLYYILMMVGENMVESGVVEPWKGLWLSSMVLTPLGVFLTYKAANDSALFDLDAYKRRFNKIFRSVKK